MTNTDTDDDPFAPYREQVDRPLLRLFDEYGRPEGHWFALGVLANLVGRGAALVPPLVFGAAIDGVLREGGQLSLPLIPQAWIPAGQLAGLQFAVALIAAAFLVGATFTWVWGVSINVFAHRVQHAVRTDTFERMQRLDMAFFDDKQTGEVISILNNDVSNLEIFLDNALSNAVRILLLIAGISAILVYLNAALAAVTLLVVPAIGLFTYGFMRLVAPRYRAVRESVGDLNTRLENALGGIGLVKTSTAEAHEAGRVREASRAYYERNMAVLRLSYFYRPGMELLAGLAFAATFLLGGYWIVVGPPFGLTGTLTVGEFVVFILLIRRLVEPLGSVSDIVDWSQNARASAERVFGLMDTPVHVTDAPDAVALDNVRGRVEYDDVTFAYGARGGAPPATDGGTDTGDVEAVDPGPDAGPGAGAEPSDPVLRDVSFVAEPGETVALVGPTGAGKSTVAKLLLRLYDPTDGVVRLDGHDLRGVTRESLRDAVGYVSQETFLFDGTVAENVRYGRFDASRDGVEAAVEGAQAAAFVREMPDGYDTQVGERGVKLSGGQRQRLAIARMLLKDPAVVVLDEATASVDTATEFRIQQSLADLTADRTTLVIAHRLSTVKDADRILVIEDGRVVERGSHDELLDEGGLYANLWRVQTGDTDGVEGFDAGNPPGPRWRPG